jgi:hypothetical protein
MQRLNSFIQSITWWDLVPSGLNGMINLITSGGSTPSNTHYVAAAATSSGSLLVAYVPPAHNGSITVNMTAMSDSAQARWFDPTSGIYTTIPGSPFPNTGSQQFTPPGTNSGGKKDWVLILETMQSAACSVPTPHNTVKITATSAKLKWGITGTPTGFDARYKLTSSGTWLHKSVNIGTHKSVTLQNLQPSSEYEWQVSAKCDQQTSAYSSSLLFTTLPLKAGESLIALDNFLIYPKPASSILNIHSPADEELSKIFIYDIQGNTMEQTNFSNQINISGLQNGIFFLRIMDKEGNFVYTTKLIVQQ